MAFVIYEYSAVFAIDCRLMGDWCVLQANIDGVRFILDLQHNLERQIAFDAVMRVRTSTGIRPVNFYGHLLANRSTDIELASINADKVSYGMKT